RRRDRGAGPPGHGAGEPSAGRREGVVQRRVHRGRRRRQPHVLRPGGGRDADGVGGARRPHRRRPQPRRRQPGRHHGGGGPQARPPHRRGGVAVLRDGRGGRPARRAGRHRLGVRRTRRFDQIHAATGDRRRRPADLRHPQGQGAGLRGHDGGRAATGARPSGGVDPPGRGRGRVTGLPRPRFTAWPGLIEAYRDRLPVSDATPVITLREGATPLLAAPYLSERVDARVLLKYEGLNPTGSFKDRGMTVAISKAVEEGSKAVICASTGNTSASAAAYATRAGLVCAVLIPEGHIALGKLAQALIHGAKVIQIKGNFDQALTVVRELASRDAITLVNSVNPYRLEGQKTAAFEIV